MSRLFAKWFAAAVLVLLAGAEARAVTIRVKLLVDEEEPAVERLWKERLEKRLSAASKIIGRYGDVRFVLADFGTWETNDRVNEFTQSLLEFQRKVPRGSADVAIGFSSQYRFTPGRHHLGGIRGPMSQYILIRESNPRITEIERVEVLVHELGHFLGAAHSSREDSVMRPVVGDGKARARSFEIGFDEDNAEIIRLVAKEMSTLRVRSFVRLTDDTKKSIRVIYSRIARQLPEDPAADRFIQIIDRSMGSSGPSGQKRIRLP